MRVGILGDTHGLLQTAYKALEAMGAIDLLIHTGDHYRDASEIASKISVPIHAVVGNCDSRTEGPEEKVLRIDGINVYITHGHRYNVKISIYGLYNRAIELKAGVAVYGHTHVPGFGYTKVPYISNKEGLLIINPGSISCPRNDDRLSYAILEVENGVTRPGIYFL